MARSSLSRMACVAVAWVAAASLSPVPADTGETDALPDPSLPSAGGRIAWIFSDDLDLVGDLWADVPFFASPGGAGFVAVETRTAIRKATSLTFDVRDLTYSLEAGARRRVSPHLRVSGAVGQSGLERTDAAGSARVRYVGAGIEVEAVPLGAGRSRLDASLVIGGVVEERNVDADVMARARIGWSARRERVGLGLEARMNALALGDDAGVDLEAGPRLDVVLEGGPVASFRIHYLRARSALGLRTRGPMVGFEYASRARRPRRWSPPDVRGLWSVGGGDDGRAAARFELGVLSPAFARRRMRVAGDVDLELLTSDGTDDLFYVYRAALEAEAWRGVVGASFRHRSNHRRAESGAAVTSMNVVEVGWESPGFRRRPSASAGGRLGSLDGGVRVGVLLDTSFGSSGDPHAWAAIRYGLPRFGGRVLPFVALEAEEGGARRRAYEIGLALPGDVEIRAGYRSDEQLYAADRTSIVVSGSVRF